MVSGKYYATLEFRGRQFTFGPFYTETEAAVAYDLRQVAANNAEGRKMEYQCNYMSMEARIQAAREDLRDPEQQRRHAQLQLHLRQQFQQ